MPVIYRRTARVGSKRKRSAIIPVGLGYASRRIAKRQRGFVRTSGYYGRYSGPTAERKFFDTDLAAIFGTIGAVFEAANLNIIVQGNTESNRIGRKCVVKRIDIKGSLVKGATSVQANTSDVLKLCIVQDKQTNGAAFTGLNLWETNVWESFNNLANSSRFRILATKNYTMSNPSGSGRGSTDTLSFGETVRTFKFGLDCNIPLEFDNSATTGAVTTQRSNSLWLVGVTTQGLIVMDVGTCRIRFTDG